MRTQPSLLGILLFLRRLPSSGQGSGALGVLLRARRACFYGAPRPHAGGLPAAQAPLHPGLAHPELPAQLRDRERLHSAAPLLFLRARSSLPRRDALLQLHEGALELLEGLVVGWGSCLGWSTER